VKATLIYPPIGDPRAPQLALPSLAAVMRRAGIETDLVDLNLAGIVALLRPDRLRHTGDVLRERDDRSQRILGDLALLAAESSNQALATLRDTERFYDANDYNAARDTIFTGLAATSASASTPVALGLLPIRYDVPGADAQCLADLIRVTSDRRANLFADHWEEDVFPSLERARPDFIGITITNRQQIIPGLMLARNLRERGHFVVIGGALYTKFVDQLRLRPDFFRAFADGVVVYEGETAVVALAHELAGARRFDRVPNYLHLGADGVVRMGPIKVENVEELPTPDFSGLRLADYLTPTPVLPILTGKGCYFNRCKFCDIPYINHVAQKAYRVRSPEKIVGDVKELSQRFGSRHFVITDEALAPKLLDDLAAAFEASGPERYSFTGYARLEPGFTAGLCRRLRQMGMRKLFFGMESAAQETLDHMDKGTNVHEAPAVLRNCRDAGIAFHLFSIIGFPEESEDSARRTFQFFIDHKDIVDHPSNSFDIHPFGLELRTEYFAQREARGVAISPAALAKDFPVGIASDDWINTRGLSMERVSELIEQEFYPHLRRVYRDYHNTRGQLWPGFEEYSMLYSDRYIDRPFPFATSMRRAGAHQQFRIRINPAVVASETTGLDGAPRVLLANRLTTALIPVALHGLLSNAKTRSLDEFAAEAVQLGYGSENPKSREDRLSEDIDRLIELGFVQVEVF
jgi:anaerobic magnesium-protoporphyrin IX monomethyl ester cyclase